jgi:hypothetical protein
MCPRRRLLPLRQLSSSPLLQYVSFSLADNSSSHPLPVQSRQCPAIWPPERALQKGLLSRDSLFSPRRDPCQRQSNLLARHHPLDSMSQNVENWKNSPRCMVYDPQAQLIYRCPHKQSTRPLHSKARAMQRYFRFSRCVYGH